jgi:hypothetical protein
LTRDVADLRQENKFLRVTLLICCLRESLTHRRWSSSSMAWMWAKEEARGQSQTRQMVLI